MKDTESAAKPTSAATSIAFCGGASGGHVTPLIAIAEELTKRVPGVTLHWLGSARDIERRMLADWSHAGAGAADSPRPAETSAFAAATPDSSQTPLQVTEVAPARPFSFSRQPFHSGWTLLKGVRRARKALKATNANVVLGSGGYASVPGILAASALKLPILLFEPNAEVGRANRVLSRLAREMLTAVPLANEAQLHCDLVPVGCPIRGAILDMARVATRPHQTTLLVLGGSQGAEFLNKVVPEILGHAVGFGLRPKCRVVHQCGVGRQNKVIDRYRAKGCTDVEVVELITDMPQALADASAVITRAGAITLAEVAAFSLPAVVVPLGSSADQHQMANAGCYVASHGFRLVDETAADAKTQLEAAVAEMLCEPQRSPVNCGLPAHTAASLVVDRLLLHAGATGPQQL